MHPLDFLDAAVTAYRARVAFTDDDGDHSYGELDLMSRGLADRLLSAGLRAHDGVAICSWSDPRVLPCVVGIMRAGGVVLPVNAALSKASATSFLRFVEPRWLIHHPAFGVTIDALQRDVPALAGVFSLAEVASAPSARVSAAVPDSQDAAGAARDADVPVTIAPTGGTTGTAKAVLIRAAAYAAYVEAYREFLSGDDDHPVCLTASQLTPASLGMAFVMATLGARHIVLPTFSATGLLQHIERYRVTHLWLPAAALYGVLGHTHVRDYDLSSIRAVVIGGSAVAPDRLREAVELFGPRVHHSYGQIETGILAWLDARSLHDAVRGNHPRRVESCGRINDRMQVAIHRADGRSCAAAETGEIVARGVGVSAYYGHPALAMASSAYGWHRTGDLGYIDEHGFLYVVGRLKDAIVTGGINVYPAEVEAALLERRDIRECAVFGVADEVLGETVAAAVVPQADAVLTREAVLTDCRRRLGAVKAPKHVQLWGDLPKTPAGKIDRAAVRRRFDGR